MAKDKVSNCLFCGNAPCTCFDKPKEAKKSVSKKSTPRKQAPTPSAESSPPSRTDPKAAMRAAAASVVPGNERVFDRHGIEVIQHADLTDDELRLAISSLEPILHPSEIKRYASCFTPSARAEAWRARKNRSPEQEGGAN